MYPHIFRQCSSDWITLGPAIRKKPLGLLAAACYHREEKNGTVSVSGLFSRSTFGTETKTSRRVRVILHGEEAVTAYQRAESEKVSQY
jgi:hypothetical protein